MHVAGSAEECERAHRELRRAAAEVSRTARALHWPEDADWVGTSAQGWGRLTSRRVAELDRLADALAGLGRAVRDHATGLEQLQDDARRLTAQAADAGLVLDAQGWIRPVSLPDSGLPALLREALHRQESRRRVLAGVAELRARERELHDRLRAALRSVHDCSPARRDHDRDVDVDVDIAWSPTGWDAPALTVSTGQAAAERAQRLPAVLRHTTSWSGVGFGVGVVVDRQAGRDWDDAITKNVIVSGVAVGAGVILAPAAAPAAVVVGAGAVLGYGAGKLFDAFGHRLPWVEKPRPAPARPPAGVAGGPRPTPRPTPGPVPRPAAAPAPPDVHRAPSSTAGPRPLPRTR